MSDNTTLALIDSNIASKLAELAVNKPEQVYEQLVKAEKWVKEIKDLARKEVIKRMGDTPKVIIETDTYDIHAVRNKPKFKTEVVARILIGKQIDAALVLFKTIVYEPLPNARETLENMLKSNIITQAEYSSMFDEPITTVSVKPKSIKKQLNFDGTQEE